jgi:hypothetical protein
VAAACDVFRDALCAHVLLLLLLLLMWCRDSTIPLTSPEAQQKQDQQGRRGSSAGGGAFWVSLMRSSAVWAIVVNNFAFHYAFYLVMNWLPTYFNRCVM